VLLVEQSTLNKKNQSPVVRLTGCGASERVMSACMVPVVFVAIEARVLPHAVVLFLSASEGLRYRMPWVDVPVSA
jgi:hypothetical protein